MASEALTTATVSVAIGEIGDKTQWLTLVLTAGLFAALGFVMLVFGLTAF